FKYGNMSMPVYGCFASQGRSLVQQILRPVFCCLHVAVRQVDLSEFRVQQQVIFIGKASIHVSFQCSYRNSQAALQHPPVLGIIAQMQDPVDASEGIVDLNCRFYIAMCIADNKKFHLLFLSLVKKYRTLFTTNYSLI